MFVRPKKSVFRRRTSAPVDAANPLNRFSNAIARDTGAPFVALPGAGVGLDGVGLRVNISTGRTTPLDVLAQVPASRATAV